MKWLKKFFKIGRFNKKQYKADKTSTTTTTTTSTTTTTTVIKMRYKSYKLSLKQNNENEMVEDFFQNWKV